MARIRTIKPEFPQSESMGRISREARLCFILLWTTVDDSGRARASSRLLASLLFPYDDDAPALMEGWLVELEDERCIDRYEINGNLYLQICKWQNHQKIDKPSESRLPAFDEDSRLIREPSRGFETDLVPSTVDLGMVPSTKPSRAKKPREVPTKTGLAQSRHAEFKAAIGEYWVAKNPGVEMPWGPAEGKNLGMWLKESPLTTVEQFKVLLRNRFRSDTNHAERASRWIGNVTSYAAGPLNQFGKPKGANGNGAQNGNTKEQDIRDANQQLIAKWDAQEAASRDHHHGGVAEAWDARVEPGSEGEAGGPLRLTAG